MDLEDLVEDVLKNKHKKYHKKNKLNWYPGKMLLKLFEAIAEIIGAILMIFLIARIFELDFTSIASVAGGIVAFLIIRFVIDELFG